MLLRILIVSLCEQLIETAAVLRLKFEASRKTREKDKSEQLEKAKSLDKHHLGIILEIPAQGPASSPRLSNEIRDAVILN